MNKKLRWGILGTGNIARQFCQGVAGAERCVLAAVGSRSVGSARSFAAEHRIPTAHPGYQALVADAEVDAVYVALPNTLHLQWTLAALEAGKHVLCEKPLALSAAQAEQMFDAASSQGLLLMEGFMYRCHPLIRQALERVASGAVGQVRLVRTSFCYAARSVEHNIRFAPELGGGALLDVGCYCVDFSRLVAGAEPSSVQLVSQRHASGVDRAVAGLMEFPGGVLAQFSCAMDVQADNAAQICGDQGHLVLPVPWKPGAVGAQYTIRRQTPPRMDGGGSAPEPVTRQVDAGKPLYALEADDFAAAVLDGATPAMSPQDSLGTARALDRLRALMA